MNRLRFAFSTCSSDGVQRGREVVTTNPRAPASVRDRYGRTDVVVTRDVSFVNRGAFGQVVAQPFSSVFPRPPPPPPPRAGERAVLNAPRPEAAPRPPPPPPRPPPRPADTSARSRLMKVGSSDAR